jgi:hypothetical protein
MKALFLLSALILVTLDLEAQTCDEVMRYVKSKGYGTDYTSYNSDAISKVTFYDIVIDHKTEYFAIVCFKSKYSYGCAKYIYQVASNTESNYSINYYNSAGKAFWSYIQPYRNVLGCGPDL